MSQLRPSFVEQIRGFHFDIIDNQYRCKIRIRLHKNRFSIDRQYLCPRKDSLFNDRNLYFFQIKVKHPCLS